jgi:hypothetical protein
MDMRTRTSLLAVLLATLLAGGTLAGCGAADNGSGTARPDDTAQSGGNVPSTPSTGGSASLPPGAKVSPPPGGTPTTAEFTITGIPQEGVESGCIVMRSGELLYNLIGGDRQTLMSGRTVVVRGRPTPGLVTTCQQGTPFQVSEVRLA